MLDEGYIKFDLRWRQTPPLQTAVPAKLIDWRNRLYDEGLIGVYADSGIGYGNISVREGAGMLISGSGTGAVPKAGAEHFARVTSVDVNTNRVDCEGPVKASSESMTHAMIYAAAPAAQAVIHVHHMALWRHLLGQVPTSRAEVPYGTPEMAHEIERLFREANLRRVRIMAMAGHEEGIISFGGDLAAAAQPLFQKLQTLTP